MGMLGVRIVVVPRRRVFPRLFPGDQVGLDCYLGGTASIPSSATPSFDAPLADMIDGMEKKSVAVANLSQAVGGLKIGCTEVGWISAPWASETVSPFPFSSNLDGLSRLCNTVCECASPGLGPLV